MYEEAVNPSRFDIIKWRIDNKVKNKDKGGNYYYSEAFHPPPVPAPPLPLENASSIVLNDRFSTNSTDELLSNKRNTINSNDLYDDENIYATYNEAINNTYI